MATAFEEIMEIRGRGLPASGEVQIAGGDPVLPTKFKIAETLAQVLAGVGVAISDIWEIRTGRRQTASIDVRHAAAGLRSSYHMRLPAGGGGFKDVSNPEHEAARTMTQPWPTKDGRWFLPHFGLPNLKARVLEVLGCDATPEAVADAVASWDALALEAAIDEARACGAMVRSHDEWQAEPHGRVLAAKPVVEIVKIGESDPEPLAEAARPLSGIRTLDLTRILAGPVAARTLAEHGGDVLMVTAEGLPQVDEHVIDTSHGKRSCFLDLKMADEAATLKELVRDADVFSQGYRPGTLEGLGFGADDLARIRPGIIYASISCFGADGPFSHRAGWEQIGQTVTGICHEGSPDRPKLLPGAACDYITGYLGAFGILLALARRAREGGSYHVKVSLCQSGMMIYRQGAVAFDSNRTGLSEEEIDAIRITSETHRGPLRHLRPLLQLSETPARWARPTPVLGGDPPVWLAAAAGRVRAAE